MTRTALIVASFTLFTTCTQADVAAPQGLCSAGETPYFVCQTGRQKVVSLCGTPPGKLQYRFGTKARVELSFPEDASTGAKSFLFAHYFRFQTDRTEVSFTNKAVDYAIFDYTEDRKRRAGVRVTSADGKETEIVCSGAISSRLPELKSVLRCDPDNALNGGSCR